MLLHYLNISNGLNNIQKYKHVPVSEETYQILKHMGTLGDTFESVITRLIKQSTAAGAECQK
jgi:hypothetical protein